MAANLVVGERIYVPVSLLEKKVKSPSAFHKSDVLEIVGRKVRVDVGGGDTELVASSKCQRNIGVAIISVGDLETEAALIEPLSKSVLQFVRLLCADDHVRLYRVRSVNELSQIWAIDHGAYSHVVVIGHGDGTALKFAVDGWAGAEALRGALDIPGMTPKCFINLSCMLGKAAYAKPFSGLNCCEAFIAPFHEVHGAIASHFVQTFLIYNLLHGETVKVAFRHARNWVAGSTSFRMWQNEGLIKD